MKNNKGFSLVELIIVIAIMAVLVGVLAPTYLQYVEKSKKSNDVSTVDTIINACETAAVDPEVQTFGTVTILLTDSACKVTGSAGSDAPDVINGIIGNDAKLKSSKWDTTDNTIQFTATANTEGKVTFAYSTADGKGGANTKFEAYATSITKLN